MPQDSTAQFDVLANDSDPDGDNLTLSITTTVPPSGVASIESGQISYTPPAGYFGDAQIGYTIADGNGGTATANLAVTVTEVETNQPPVAVDDTGTMPQDSTAQFDVLANDSDPDGDNLTLSITTTVPPSGVASIESGQISYTPPAGYFGDAQIGYTIADGNGGTATANLAVTVTEVETNQPPVAVDDTGTMPQDSTAQFDVLANDSDPDGDNLTLSISTAPLNGNATLVGGKVEYTPTIGFVGTDFVGYTIEDGDGATDTATLTVDVAEVVVPEAQKMAVNGKL